MLKIGVIGCGAIGAEICKAIDAGVIGARLEAVYDRSTERCEKMIRTLKNKPAISGIDELIKSVDIVVECASQEAVREHGLNVLKNGKDLMIMSVGAMLDSGLLNKFINAARDNRCKIYIPSGAIASIDGLKSASVASIYKVMLSTTKNPKGLAGAPYITRNKIDLASFHKKTLLFKGSAEDAVKAFPQNINVAASLSLAGIGPGKTEVRVFVDPKASRNIHEITVEGDFGAYTCHVENVQSPSNPKTSYLAALSAIATLKKITEPLQTGT